MKCLMIYHKTLQRFISRSTAIPTILHVRQSKTDQPAHARSLISLRCPHKDALDPWLPTECSARTD